MSVVRWEDPPPRRRPGNEAKRGRSHRDWSTTGNALRDQPGRWAVVSVAVSAHAAASLAKAIESGRYSGMGAGPFEACSRTVNDEFLTYARYVREAGSVATPNDLQGPTGEVRSA